ncbi:LipL41-expression chaperone Lep [Leptospira perolatii]|uniref:LipL41-expression chaperone Lep n=1 Tax=Leptospira perolatii TaxID=2023191 RepID=A0A2M9ZSN9_9LEPT|nr:LipL41-expression chaperone Lep [Leptospira perolatii]PJZ71501.1 LipL41-expression chaperone Lep [Leptospira perolatii]PJZ75035.1 LipL41-expression chaperone Lep [Leptospira perolatii]
MNLLLTSNLGFHFHTNRKSGRISSAFLFCFLLLNSNCTRTTPTPEECVDAQVHIVKLIADDQSMDKQVQALMLRSILKPEMNEAIVKNCVLEKTLKQVKCELEATKFTELKKCKKEFGKPDLPPT